MVMVNFFLTIDHGVNSRVSWSWSVPYPPPYFDMKLGGGGFDCDDVIIEIYL